MAEEFTKMGYELISGGTETHLLLCDLTNKGVTGQQAQDALDKAGITLNKNTVPFDQRSPFDPSGIRFGTPAITTRGFKEEECREVARYMDEVIRNHDNQEVLDKTRENVRKLCAEYPVPGIKI